MNATPRVCHWSVNSADTITRVEASVTENRGTSIQHRWTFPETLCKE